MNFRILFAAALFPLAGHAATIDATLVATGRGHVQVDDVTGRVHGQSGYFGSGFGYYADVADFVSGTGRVATELSPDGAYGSYYGVSNGIVLARPDQSSTVIASYDATTGAQIASSDLTQYCGANFSCGFDWGGFSSMNILQDQTGMYLLGRSSAATDEWLLSSIDTALNVTEITRFARSGVNDGYGIMIGGTLFLGESFGSGLITTAYDVLTDTLYDPDLILSAGSYLSSSFYDQTSDTLYVASGTSGEQTWAVTGAADAFGVTSPVPLPAAGWLLIAAITGTAALRRRRTAA
ncbi:VPLPA-CTERM sorting domain-containing protein [Salipiger sp.]|uniref:VPLPA-CTERM sorting domain-containing protein n=1 Tax=Salipiger sp. TaxID=2078585 RepID=UPI003A96E134